MCAAAGAGGAAARVTVVEATPVAVRAVRV